LPILGIDGGWWVIGAFFTYLLLNVIWWQVKPSLIKAGKYLLAAGAADPKGPLGVSTRTVQEIRADYERGAFRKRA
jgi:hypothetical protein